MSKEPVVPGKGDPETEINADSPKVTSFKRESAPKIKGFLDRCYVDYRREPMMILRTLSVMLGREIYIVEDYNAQTPYVSLEKSALSLHVKHDVPEAERAEYKAIINAVIKPELIRLVKELDRAAQDQLLNEAKKGLEELRAARQKLGGAEFDPIDKRLLAVTEEGDIAAISSNSGDRVRALLDGVFSQN